MRIASTSGFDPEEGPNTTIAQVGNASSIKRERPANIEGRPIFKVDSPEESGTSRRLQQIKRYLQSEWWPIGDEPLNLVLPLMVTANEVIERSISAE
jgi:hypothetical protein